MANTKKLTGRQAIKKIAANHRKLKRLALQYSKAVVDQQEYLKTFPKSERALYDDKLTKYGKFPL